MNAVLFDTLKFATALQEDDAFSAKQSARLAAALSATFESEVATRRDVRESELRLQAQIAETEARLTTRLPDAELNFATGLARLELGFTKGLAKLELGFTEGLAEIKADFLKWLIAAIGLQTIAIIVAIFGGVMTLAHHAR